LPTVNFSVPEEVKVAFNATFQGQNKSAIVAELMREAVERAHQKRRSQEAIQHILARREQAPMRKEADLQAARWSGRP
jgi:predicted secreted protein